MKQERAMDDAKRAHFKPKTAQQEQIMKLQDEIKELQIENLELRERLIDYKEFLSAMSKLEALEAWFDED